jgi:uncharacterized protein involved in type VI secretion and phage assembly
MTLAGLFTDAASTFAGPGGRVHGVVVGVVTDNKDPDSLGRVKVKLPWLDGDAESTWARVASPMAGKERGLFYLPEVDDEVLLAFEHGSMDYPYVLGALWNGKDAPPETNSDGKNNKRLIKSRAGMTILLDDTDGSEKVEIADKDGNEKIVIDMSGKKVSLTSSGDIELTAAQGKVAISAQTVEIKATGQGSLKADGTLDVGGSTVNVKGQPMVNIN